MLIPLSKLIQDHEMKISGVLHVGAHLGEEARAYSQCGVGNVTWVEGNPALITKLLAAVRPYGHHVIESLISDKEEDLLFHVTNNGESSSILQLGTHKQTSPQVHVVSTITLHAHRIDQLAVSHPFNFLNLDLQGAELLALRGATETLEKIDYIYTEVNDRHVYQNCALVHELDEFLAQFGIVRVDTLWCTDGGIDHHWGDALYVRSNP